MEEVTIPGRGTLKEEHQPKMRVQTGGNQHRVYKHVYTHDDDENIGPKKRLTLYSCSSADYPYIRGWLVDQIGSFMTLVNFPYLAGMEMPLNADNRSFTELLQNENGTSDLIIVPMQMLKDGPAPYAGVQFITTGFRSRGNVHNGKLKFLKGWSRVNLQSRMLEYHEAQSAPQETGIEEEMSIAISIGG